MLWEVFLNEFVLRVRESEFEERRGKRDFLNRWLREELFCSDLKEFVFD